MGSSYPTKYTVRAVPPGQGTGSRPMRMAPLSAGGIPDLVEPLCEKGPFAGGEHRLRLRQDGLQGHRAVRGAIPNPFFLMCTFTCPPPSGGHLCHLRRL